jgi:hypothetical protein
MTTTGWVAGIRAPLRYNAVPIDLRENPWVVVSNSVHGMEIVFLITAYHLRHAFGLRIEGRLPNMEDSYEYFEKVAAESRLRVVLQLGCWGCWTWRQVLLTLEA